MLLRENPAAGNLWWAMHKMVHYTMFRTDNLPMGSSHEDLQLHISVQAILEVELALAKIIHKMDEHLDLAGRLLQVNMPLCLKVSLLLDFVE